MALKISTPAGCAGTNAPMIRYQESICLLPRPDRRDAAHLWQ